MIPLTAPPCWIQVPWLLISPEGSGGVTVAARDLGSLVLRLCWHFLFYCPDSLTLALLRSFWPSACQVQTDWVSIQGIFISLLRNPSSHGAWSQEEAWWVAHSPVAASPSWMGRGSLRAGPRTPCLPVRSCTSDSTWLPRGPGKRRSTLLLGHHDFCSVGLCPVSSLSSPPVDQRQGGSP